MPEQPGIPKPDLTTVPRAELVNSHVIHEFDRARAHVNARGCYGQLIRRFYRPILRGLLGRRVLDCGCGFGIFSRLALDAGLQVVSIDIDDVSIELAKSISGIDCKRRSVYDTKLPPNSIDVAVCFDSIQHFEVELFLPEMRRLGVSQVVVYDSNVSNPLLNAYRGAAKHEESHDRTAEELVRQFAIEGFRLTLKRFENYISLPISGGFQRPPMPVLSLVPSVVYAVDRASEILFRIAQIDRFLAYRFLLVFESNIPA
jgi:SAM-dependent methyltransferase